VPLETARLAGRAQAAARLLRLSLAARAGQELVLLTDGLASVLSRAPSAAAALAALIGALAAAQARGDAIGLADLLEHRLAPVLAGVRSRDSSFSPIQPNDRSS
jgi:hypothetical protein